MKPTIYDIKHSTQGSNSHYFDRKTMQFFGQKMSMFKVAKSPQGRIFFYAPSYWGGRLMGYSFSEFKDNALLSVKDSCGDVLDTAGNALSRILEFIHNN